MRLLPRRARPSGVPRVGWAGVLAGALLVPSAGASPSSSGFPSSSRFPSSSGFSQGTCAGSTVTREYTPESMAFRLHLALDGCQWWDGSARNLAIWLGRDDGTEPASRYAMTDCSSGSGPGSARPSACEVSATLPHPAEEQAVTYQGEATWEWKDGPRRVSFETRCSTAAGQARCDDPVATWHG